jgi:hypothetical protein
MDIDISIGNESLSLNVDNPHRFNVRTVINDVVSFGNKEGVDFNLLDVERLIPKMVRGVAGCEAGCPSNAQSVAREGFGNFRLEYVEGGILTATQALENNKTLQIKIFPDF